MTDELREKIASLRALAPKLNASTTEAEKVVQETESILEGLGVGIPASVPLGGSKLSRDENGRSIETSQWLGYGRIGGRFRIVVIDKFYYDEDGDGNYELPGGENTVVIWGSCPRALKLSSFTAIPRLLGKIVDEVVQLSKQADETVEQVRTSVASFFPDPSNRTKVFTVAVLKGEQWHDIGSAQSMATAVEIAKGHFRSDKSRDQMSSFRTSPDLEFRLYDLGVSTGWEASLLEVGPDHRRPMMALAMYKIMECYIRPTADKPAKG